MACTEFTKLPRPLTGQTATGSQSCPALSAKARLAVQPPRVPAFQSVRPTLPSSRSQSFCTHSAATVIVSSREREEPGWLDSNSSFTGHCHAPPFSFLSFPFLFLSLFLSFPSIRIFIFSFTHIGNSSCNQQQHAAGRHRTQVRCSRFTPFSSLVVSSFLSLFPPPSFFSLIRVIDSIRSNRFSFHFLPLCCDLSLSVVLCVCVSVIWYVGVKRFPSVFTPSNRTPTHSHLLT